MRNAPHLRAAPARGAAAKGCLATRRIFVALMSPSYSTSRHLGRLSLGWAARPLIQSASDKQSQVTWRDEPVITIAYFTKTIEASLSRVPRPHPAPPRAARDAAFRSVPALDGIVLGQAVLAAPGHAE